MKLQQCRRLFFKTATSNTNRLKEVGDCVWKRCFRPCGWIAVTLSAALLVMSCSSLTPERVSVLSQIAGQAAALGAEEWLAKHPEHRQAFLDAVAALGAVLKTDTSESPLAPQSIEDAAVSFLSKLPTGTLRGKDGELYVTGDTNGPASLVVWDPALKKGVEVSGESARPVVKQIYLGMRRALGPKPPVPVVAGRARKPEDLEGRTPEAPKKDPMTDYVPDHHVIGGTPPPLTPPPPRLTRVSGLSVESTFDVTLNEHGVQQVNVRWVMEPNASYTIQRMEENKAWEGFVSATNTNAVATACLWRTLWHHHCPVGLWRVVRR